MIKKKSKDAKNAKNVSAKKVTKSDQGETGPSSSNFDSSKIVKVGKEIDIVNSAIVDRQLKEDASISISIGKSDSQKQIEQNEGKRDVFTEKDKVVTHQVSTNSTELDKIVAASGVSTTVIKDRDELLSKIQSAKPDYLKQVTATKEVLVDASSYVDIDAFKRDIELVRDTTREVEVHDYDLVRKTVQVKRLKLPPTNLTIIRSMLGKKAVMIEQLPYIELLDNVELNLQMTIIAINFIKQYQLSSPCVLDVGSNCVTENYNIYDRYTLDGFKALDIGKALGYLYKSNDQLSLTPRQLQDLNNTAVIINTVGGESITSCYDGRVQSQIINEAIGLWRQYIIKLSDYLIRIRSQIPDVYRPKEYSALELEHGRVFFRPIINNLHILVELENEKFKEFFLRIYLTFLDDIPLSHLTSQSLSKSVGSDLNLAATRATPGSLVINSISMAHIKRTTSIYLLSCITSNMHIEISFSHNNDINDALAAIFVIIFVSKHAITDDFYASCLRVILTYINNSCYQNYHSMSTIQLINELTRSNWGITQLITGEIQSIAGSPIFSDGVSGSFYVPFNLSSTGEHLYNGISSLVNDLRNRRFRQSNNNQFGSTLATFINYAARLAMDNCSSYTTIISRLRGTVPNVLAESLDLRGSVYNIQAVDFVSFFLTLDGVQDSDPYQRRIDAFAEKRLIDFTTLSDDITKCIVLIKSIISANRPVTVSTFKYTSAITDMIAKIWEDSDPDVSKTLLSLLGIAAADGKRGYNSFMMKLSQKNYEIDNDPMYKLIKSVSNIIRSNLSSFGVTYEVLFVPRGYSGVARDARLDGIFWDCPFVASMPVNVPSVHYVDLKNSDNAMEMLSRGVIVTGAPFRFRYSIKAEYNCTRLVTNFIDLDEDQRLTFNEIAWELAFKENVDRVKQMRHLFDKEYQVLVKTPENLIDLSEYKHFHTKYESADTKNIYLSDHTFLYSRI